jgi:hypothetical protein
MQGKGLGAFLIAGVSIRKTVIGGKETQEAEEIREGKEVEETEECPLPLQARSWPNSNSCHINPELA